MIMPKITLDLAPALVLVPVHVLEEVDRYIQFNFWIRKTTTKRMKQWGRTHLTYAHALELEY